jgi:hypothetical protein
MLDAQTGYVRLSEFGENTDQELGQALRALQRQGMKRLVPGSAEQSGRRAGSGHQRLRNRFLPRGAMVVYTRGRVPELRPGLPRHGIERLPECPDGYADESQQRQRVGNCVRVRYRITIAR